MVEEEEGDFIYVDLTRNPEKNTGYKVVCSACLMGTSLPLAALSLPRGNATPPSSMSIFPSDAHGDER